MKQKTLGLSEGEMRELFAHFDAEGTGEINYWDLRHWLVGECDGKELRR
jgi:Ca2+-binding EF-hand superfamily protein